MLGIIGMLLAIAIMIFFAYKGVAAIPLTLMASVVIILTSGLPMWETYAKTYAGSFGGVITSYFFIFVSSSIYARLMEITGSTTTIGNKFIDWFGAKRVMLVSMLFVTILVYGGVSVFVVIFAAYPILFFLFKEANLPRHLCMAPFYAGCAGIAMTSLPGSPQLTNVIPSQYFGTPLTAAPIFSLIISVVMGGMCYYYCLWVEKKARARGETWTYPANFDPSSLEIKDKSLLPGTFKAFAPIVVLIAFIILGSVFKAQIPFANDAALLTTLAMITASIVCIVLNADRLDIVKVRDAAGTGSSNAIMATIGLAAVVSFGSVVAASPAFQDVVAWVMGVEMSPYYKGIFSTAVISGITGSSSGGVRLALQNMSEYFIASGADLQILHRLMAVAAGSLDTLPHVSGIFLVFSIFGLTHKEAYKHVGWTTVIIPGIVSIVFAIIATMMF